MARVLIMPMHLAVLKNLCITTLKSRLGLLNIALNETYRLKFKAIDKNLRYYHLVCPFGNKDAPKLQNGEDIHYGYNKLPPDELPETVTK
ncbi:hypothetical protein Glove_146g59 [Diversispora epigaea]|uniref:Uncharacterized protein n=1 Tax=Diversispora epigaea TaxID=1348612 RepID=A0A397ITY9_9GLOM|nr:hypothetical protein Glove_146g59 [Diversispora epigaea]